MYWVMTVGHLKKSLLRNLHFCGRQKQFFLRMLLNSSVSVEKYVYWLIKFTFFPAWSVRLSKSWVTVCEHNHFLATWLIIMYTNSVCCVPTSGIWSCHASKIIVADNYPDIGIWTPANLLTLNSVAGWVMFCWGFSSVPEFPFTKFNCCFCLFVAEENMLWRAKNYGDAKLYQQATDIKTPACDKIQQIYSWLIALDMVCGVCVSVLIPSYLRSFVLSVHMSVLGRKKNVT